MRAAPQNQTPLESPSEKLINVRQVRRVIRGVLIVVAVGLLWVELIGEPLLRWEYHYQGRYSEMVITDAVYVGFSGRLEAYAGEYAEGCPLILFVKPDSPLWRRCVAWAATPSPANHP